MIEPDFEDRLVEAIQPIRQLAVANAIHQLHDSGLYASLADPGGIPVDELATRHSMLADRLSGFLRYLRNEGYVTVAADRWTLSEKARRLEPFLPWYTLLVGGYASTFTQIQDTLRTPGGYASRDGGKVGRGSCGISMFDALPLARTLIDTTGAADVTVVDVGCGDGSFLAELCASHPGVFGVGLEPDAGGFALAERTVAERSLEGRMEVRHHGATDLRPDTVPAGRPVVFMAAFVLQEVLEQAGEEAVLAILRSSVEAHPDAHWVVIEVDHRPEDQELMGNGLGLAYYNPYYLLHTVTEQRLETRSYWEGLFARAGLEVVRLAHPDPRVDSTSLELGYLLRRCRGETAR
ncbi:2-ketoarginine methyltransferase [Streptomyces hygroscopicus]|uniref:2-ketoarginine methyltransferase n=1 Tax=Streptomyces TaxID=1883 RepID=UPI0025AFBEF3|nr:2-ketoarginine methyltransferase [Streptomyces sp. SRF1]MDN3053591.1 2-ketoarginine methyltransferase [Streptomyces sp. SRF1]